MRVFSLWFFSKYLTKRPTAISTFSTFAKNCASFSFFDVNGDGKITEHELNDGRAKRQAKKASEGKMLRNAQSAPSFSEIDTNGDGYISKDEFEMHQKTRHAQ